MQWLKGTQIAGFEGVDASPGMIPEEDAGNNASMAADMGMSAAADGATAVSGEIGALDMDGEGVEVNSSVAGDVEAGRVEAKGTTLRRTENISLGERMREQGAWR